MIRVKVDVDGIVRELGAVGDVLRDGTNAALKKLGAHLRKQAQKRFDEQGPGWPALAPSTLKARAEGGAAKSAAAVETVAKAKLKKKLLRELRRATKQGSMQAIAQRQAVLDEYSRQVEGSSRPSAIPELNDGDRRVLADRRVLQRALSDAKKTKNRHTVERVKSQLDAFDAQHAGTIRKAALGRAAKSISQLPERLGRQAKKVEGKVLGKMASSVSAKASGGTLTVGSKIPWSSVHNEGGTAGKGATEPKREFLPPPSEDDLKFFETVLAEEIAKKIAEGA